MKAARLSDNRIRRFPRLFAFSPAARALLVFCACLFVCALLPLAAFPSRGDNLLGSVYDLAAPDGGYLRRDGTDYLFFPYRREGENVCARVYGRTPDLYYAEAVSLPFFCEDADGDPLSAIATLTLVFSDGETLSASASSAGEEVRLCADLRSLAGERLLVSFSVSFKISSPPEGALCFVGEPAAEAETDAAFAERFFCRSFTAEKGSIVTGDGGATLTAHFYGAGSLIEGAAGARVADAETNALRISVASCSRSCELAIYCLFGEEETFPDEPAATVSLVRSQTETVYFAEIRGAGEAKKLRFVSTQNGLSTVVFTSVLAVSTYAPGSDWLGDVSACRLSDDGTGILVRGSLPASLAVSGKEERLLVYALAPEEDLSSLAGAEPVASGPVSVRFAFRIPVSGEDDRLLSRKFVVLMTEGGVPTDPPRLLATPFYVDKEEDGASAPVLSAAAFKGVLCGGETAFADSEPGSVILDVDLSRLCDLSGRGYVFRSGGEACYFDREESDRLRARLAEYSACGVPVFLRLLASNPGKSVPFTYSYNESGVFSYALNAESEKSRAFLEAAVRYLFTDLAADPLAVSGLILGKNADSSGSYNFMGADVPLDEYAEAYLLALRTVSRAASRCRPGILLFVPVDDRYQNENVGRRFLFPDYDVSLFLEALCARAADEGGGLSFSVLIESSAGPTEEKPDPFSLAEMGALLSSLNASYGVSAEKPFLLWSPENAADPAAAYSLLYYRALFSDAAGAFFLDLSGGDGTLASLCREIDTVNTLNATAGPLARLGVLAERDLAGFDGAKLVLRDVKKTEAAAPLASPAGSALYRSFAERSALAAVLPAGKTAVSYADGAVLCSFPAGGGSAILSLPEISLFSCAKILAFSFECVIMEESAEAELVFLCGETVYRVSVPADTGRIALDTEPLSRLSDVRAVILSLSGEATVRLLSFAGESDVLSDDALALAVRKRLSGGAPLPDPSRAEWGMLLLALVSISGASAFLMRRKKRIADPAGRADETPYDPGSDRPISF